MAYFSSVLRARAADPGWSRQWNLSIRGPVVSLGPPRVDIRRGQSPTPHTPGLPSVETYQHRCLARHLAWAEIPQVLLSEPSGTHKRLRTRCRRLPTTRSTPKGVQKPIYIRKKYEIWTRWRPVPVKNVNYPRAPSSRRSGLVGPHTTPAIVNYKYMTSTL